MGPGTNKHNIRVDDETRWTPAVAKVARLAEQGYPSLARDEGNWRGRKGLTMTDIVCAAIDQLLAETDEETIARLKLTKSEG